MTFFGGNLKRHFLKYKLQYNIIITQLRYGLSLYRLAIPTEISL